MKGTQLYEQLLGLGSPWTAERVELDVAGQEVSVFVAGAEGASWHCPQCQRESPGYDLREERRWRHLDSCGFMTWLIARTPRVECSEHGVKTVNIPWAGPKSRFTLAFECFAITLLRATKVQSRTAHLLKLCPGQVHDIMQRAVARGLSRRNRDEVMPHLALDEKSFHRGHQCLHQYVTVLSDLATKRVLEVAQDRTTLGTADLLSGALSAQQKQGVEAVSMDMWAPFMKGCAIVLPGADVVHDRFHVMRYIAEAVDKTRRMEHKRLMRSGKNPTNRAKKGTKDHAITDAGSIPLAVKVTSVNVNDVTQLRGLVEMIPRPATGWATRASDRTLCWLIVR